MDNYIVKFMDHKEYRLAVIMFTDIVGFSRMMEKDEAGTLKLMDYHDGLVRASIAAWGGKVIKTIGDAFLAEFSNAGNAVKCGIEVQKKLEEYNAAKPAQPLVLRIGVHLGDIYFFENDALGEGINIASRLQSLCKPGRICISQEVFSTVSNKIDTPIKPMGQVSLKNISRSIHAYEVMCNGSAEAASEDLSPETSVPVLAEPSSVPSAGSHEKAGPLAGAKLSDDEVKAVRSQVFGAIKAQGRRISVDEARALVDIKGPQVDSYLVELSASGFLVKDSAPQAGRSKPEESASDRYEELRERGRSRRHGSFDSEEIGDMARQAGRVIREFAEGITEEIKAEVEEEKSRRTRNHERAEKNFDFAQIVEHQQKSLQKEIAGFRSHAISFAAVNAFLWFIWLMNPATFAWPLIVTLAWGIGLVTHADTVRTKKKEQKILDALPSLKMGQWNLLRKLFKLRRGWNGHWVSNLAVSAFLLVLNLLVSPEFMWFVFPLAGMGLGVFTHLPSFKSKEQEALAELAAAGVPVEILGRPENLKEIQSMRVDMASGPVAAEAEQYRRRILQQIKAFKGRNPLGSDFPKTLDDYVRQIKALSLRDQEITLVLDRIDMKNFEADYTRNKSEYEAETNPRLKVEYEKTLEQMDAQRKAHEDIVGEQKLLQLRLQNAINGLKRLEMDITRMSSTSSSGTGSSTPEVMAQKSTELHEYMEDLKQGYDEIEKIEDYSKVDPFEQLMKKAEAEAAAAGIDTTEFRTESKKLDPQE